VDNERYCGALPPRSGGPDICGEFCMATKATVALAMKKSNDSHPRRVAGLYGRSQGAWRDVRKLSRNCIYLCNRSAERQRQTDPTDYIMRTVYRVRQKCKVVQALSRSYFSASGFSTAAAALCDRLIGLRPRGPKDAGRVPRRQGPPGTDMPYRRGMRR
jgi:hypothetical protein